MSRELSGLLTERLGLAEAPLDRQTGRVGRRAPRRIRRALAAVAEAEAMAENPRLRPRIDPVALEAAHRRARVWLMDQDLGARTAQARRAMLAALVFNLALAAGLGIGVLAWTGRIGPALP